MSETNYTQWQTASLVILRLLIGWHFLYEGMIKVVGDWSAAPFLNGSVGPFSGFFKGLASHQSTLEVLNVLNQWGLVLIGLSLLLGLFSKLACIAGMLLLGMYYISYPPFIGLEIPLNNEGSYLIVNKNLIELAALFVLLLFPTGEIIGFDRLIKKR